MQWKINLNQNETDGGSGNIRMQWWRTKTDRKSDSEVHCIKSACKMQNADKISPYLWFRARSDQAPLSRIVMHCALGLDASLADACMCWCTSGCNVHVCSISFFSVLAVMQGCTSCCRLVSGLWGFILSILRIDFGFKGYKDWGLRMSKQCIFVAGRLKTAVLLRKPWFTGILLQVSRKAQHTFRG